MQSGVKQRESLAEQPGPSCRARNMIQCSVMQAAVRRVKSPQCTAGMVQPFAYWEEASRTEAPLSKASEGPRKMWISLPLAQEPRKSSMLHHLFSPKEGHLLSLQAIFFFSSPNWSWKELSRAFPCCCACSLVSINDSSNMHLSSISFSTFSAGSLNERSFRNGVT